MKQLEKDLLVSGRTINKVWQENNSVVAEVNPIYVTEEYVSGKRKRQRRILDKAGFKIKIRNF